MLLHTQLVGRKRWRLASPLQTPRLYNTRSVFSPVDLAAPDLARFPRLAGVQVFDVVLGPGETLFVPLGWWHQVEALDTSLSISFTNLDVPNCFSYHHPVEAA
jgi:ribosomal protein L16 Arg81 hydroxylase